MRDAAAAAREGLAVAVVLTGALADLGRDAARACGLDPGRVAIIASPLFGRGPAAVRRLAGPAAGEVSAMLG